MMSKTNATVQAPKLFLNIRKSFIAETQKVGSVESANSFSPYSNGIEDDASIWVKMI